MWSTVPHALPRTASGSWRRSPQAGHAKGAFAGWKRAWARRRTSVAPEIMKIMVTADSVRPVAPGSVVSPTPVVVGPVTVTWAASA
jgi:hypothetical protein